MKHMDEAGLDEVRAMWERLGTWRGAHPQATFDEIEDAVQQEMVRWQTQVVEAVMQAERPATVESRAPMCRECGSRMQGAGRRRRTILSRQGQPVPLQRDYFVCPACGAGLFPLDEVLGLAGSRYSPRVLRWVVRLGAEMPFARAACWLAELTGVSLSPATVRRLSEAVGASAVAQAEADVARLEQTMPPPEVQPERVVLGVDGAMVPLVGGIWGEVKLLCVGEPCASALSTSAPSAQLEHLSYFARLADAPTFNTQALGEVHRRGIEAAGAVAAVQDGAAWLQGFVDLHRPDAVRILDWPHACEHLTALCEDLFGAQTARAQRGAERLRRWLWEEGPDRLLAVLEGWVRAQPTLASAVAYFRARRAQLAYPAFRAQGWPVGSGATESGHKQVMQARMKRAGMHWAPSHVNPLLALTLLEHNDRWASEGPRVLQAHRERARVHRRACCRARPRRASSRTRRPTPSPTPSMGFAAPLSSPPAPPDPPRLPASPAQHPWRRYGVPLSPTN